MAKEAQEVGYPLDAITGHSKGIKVSALTDIVAGLASGLGDTAIKIRQAITGKDATLDAKLAQIAMEVEAQKAAAEASLLQGQLEIAKAQIAESTESLGVIGTNFFKFWVAGPKPFLFWVCSFAFFLQYAVQPIGTWLGANMKPIDMSVPSQIALALAGVGSIIGRVVEKVNNAAGNH